MPATPRTASSSRRRRRARLPGRVLVALVLAFVAFLYYRPLTNYVETRDSVRARSGEVARLEVERTRLQRRLNWSTSDAALRRRARCIGWVRPGERLFVVRGIPASQRSCAPN